MIKSIKLFILLSIFCVVVTSCSYEDPGPLQEISKDYSILDFDGLEMGNAFNIRVERASTFSITAKGDRRNIDDLLVYKSGTTLIIKYRDNSNRRHQTYLTITMPSVKSINFSGASVSVVKGFDSSGQLDFYLSGASIAQLDAGYKKLNLFLSGASSMSIRGLGDEMKVQISGGSVLNGFDFPVRAADANLSGASISKFTISDQLHVIATGASSVLYKGSPSVTSELSGGSVLIKD